MLLMISLCEEDWSATGVRLAVLPAAGIIILPRKLTCHRVPARQYPEYVIPNQKARGIMHHILWHPCGISSLSSSLDMIENNRP